jgi:Eco57I restriction-modification methylase
LAKSKELKTAAATFLIPMEIATSRSDVAKYSEQLELCVRNGYSANEFLERCRDEGLTVETTSLHVELYDELVQLDKANKNGVWAMIIKNAFAPIFVGPVDYVVGNPPWVNWESLPKEYRDNTIALWDKYRLRERTIRRTRLGNVKKELSVLFVYVAMDHYLVGKGTLGFVITPSTFKSGANEGFRRFELNAKQPFRVEAVSDLSLLLPFENAINRTAIVVAQKESPTEYPVEYRFWVPAQARAYLPDADLAETLSKSQIRNWLAAPVEPMVRESTWLTAPKSAFPVLRKVIGDRSMTTMERVYAGSCTWLNGAYWVDCVKRSAHTSLITNLGDIGRKKVQSVTMQVENDFLFPLLRGRDVQAWQSQPSAHILVPHREADFGEPVSLAEMKREFPHTFRYLKQFEDVLNSRSGYKQLHGSRPEFYVVGNVGNYTLSRYKVVFKELTEVFQCAVVGPPNDAGQPVIPDHKLAFIACASNQDEAYYLSGLLNSVPARVALYCASVGLQTQTYSPTDVSRVRIPDFRLSDKVHQAVVRLAKLCHTNASKGKDTGGVELELSEAAANLWGIPKKELALLDGAYSDILTFRRSSPATTPVSLDSEQE